jgi:hypothetical protein
LKAYTNHIESIYKAYTKGERVGMVLGFGVSLDVA